MLKMKGVSIIVCCFNSAERLPAALSHLAKQRINAELQCELVIVDNNSTDGTQIVAQDTWRVLGEPFPMKVVYESKPGLSYARQAGVLATKYEYGIFCDDDNWLNSLYVMTVVRIFDNNDEIGLIGGASTPEADISLPPWFYSTSNSFAVGTQAEQSKDITSRKYLWGSGLAFRVNLLRICYKSGIYPLISGRKGKLLTSGDDAEISAWYIFAGYRLYYSSELTLRHFMASTRLTDDYFNRFFSAQQNQQVRAYNDYLVTKYFLLSPEPGPKILYSYARYLIALTKLLMHPHALLNVIRVEARIKSICKRCLKNSVSTHGTDQIAR